MKLTELVGGLVFNGGPLIWITDKVTHNYLFNATNSVLCKYAYYYIIVRKN